MRTLNPEAAVRLLQLAEQSYRPAEIVALTEEIEGDKRVLELKVSIGRPATSDEIDDYVRKKLRLDGLYFRWAADEL